LSEIAPGQEDAQEPLRIVYTGDFDNGKRQGQGKVHVDGGTFQFSSVFIEDKPEFETNQVLLKLPKAQEEEEVKLDPKAAGKKPDPKAAQAKPEEEKEQKNKITYEVGKEGHSIEFEMHIVYQGLPYEDPNQPTQEEIKVQAAAPAKGGKAPAGKAAEEVKQEIRMITPEPVVMVGESGRLFELELGKHEKNNSMSKESLEPAAAEGTQHTEESESAWVNYRFNQALNLMKQRIPTE